MADQRVHLDDVPKLLTDLLVFHEYPSKALRTAKPLSFEDTLMHAGLLITSEAGEIADAIKKHLIYGKDLDKANLLEEIGDACWGLNLLLDALGFSWKEALEANIAKLEKRYPNNSYSKDNAINRDKKAEAKVFAEAKDDREFTAKLVPKINGTELATQALVDYLDDDDIPSGGIATYKADNTTIEDARGSGTGYLNFPCTEPVPMVTQAIAWFGPWAWCGASRCDRATSSPTPSAACSPCWAAASGPSRSWPKPRAARPMTNWSPTPARWAPTPSWPCVMKPTRSPKA